MKVVTKLAKMEFTIGTIDRKGENLILESGGGAEAMKVRAQITPDDIVATIKAGLNLRVLGYLVQLPILLLRRRRSAPIQKSSVPNRSAT